MQGEIVRQQQHLVGDEEAQHSHGSEDQNGRSLDQKKHERKAQNFQQLQDGHYPLQDVYYQLQDVLYQLEDLKAQTPLDWKTRHVLQDESKTHHHHLQP